MYYCSVKKSACTVNLNALRENDEKRPNKKYTARVLCDAVSDVIVYNMW